MQTQQGCFELGSDAMCGSELQAQQDMSSNTALAALLTLRKITWHLLVLHKPMDCQASYLPSASAKWLLKDGQAINMHSAPTRMLMVTRVTHLGHSSEPYPTPLLSGLLMNCQEADRPQTKTWAAQAH